AISEIERVRRRILHAGEEVGLSIPVHVTGGEDVGPLRAGRHLQLIGKAPGQRSSGCLRGEKEGKKKRREERTHGDPPRMMRAGRGLSSEAPSGWREKNATPRPHPRQEPLAQSPGARCQFLGLISASSFRYPPSRRARAPSCRSLRGIRRSP